MGFERLRMVLPEGVSFPFLRGLCSFPPWIPFPVSPLASQFLFPWLLLPWASCSPAGLSLAPRAKSFSPGPWGGGQGETLRGSLRGMPAGPSLSCLPAPSLPTQPYILLTLAPRYLLSISCSFPNSGNIINQRHIDYLLQWRHWDAMEWPERLPARLPSALQELAVSALHTPPTPEPKLRSLFSFSPSLHLQEAAQLLITGSSLYLEPAAQHFRSKAWKMLFLGKFDCFFFLIKTALCGQTRMGVANLNEVNLVSLPQDFPQLLISWSAFGILVFGFRGADLALIFQGRSHFTE